MNQKLSEWASVAELVSAIAVVVSLLYVGFQINQNTNEVRAANRQQLVSRAHSAVTAIATSPELAGIMAKVGEGSTLTSTELSQYGYLVRGVLYDVQEAYLLYQEGRLGEEYWNTRAALVEAYLAQTPARNVYHRDKSLGALHPEFVQWLDSALEERYGD